MSKNTWDIIIMLLCWFCLFIHTVAAVTGGIFLIHCFFHISILASIIIWIAWVVLSIFIIILLDSGT
jgi:hypothetical protein